MSKKYEHHPASGIFPMMESDGIAKMAEDIRLNGLIMPIEIFENQVLDGRNREKACEIAGVEPTYVECEVSDPFSYALSVNLHRRHLTTSQRAIAAGTYSVKLEQYGTVKTDKNVPANLRETSNAKGSDATAAKALSVSARSVNDGRKVVEKGTKAIQEAVSSRVLSVSSAAKVADLPKSEQNKIAKSKNPKAAAKDAIASNKNVSGGGKARGPVADSGDGVSESVVGESDGEYQDVDDVPEEPKPPTKKPKNGGTKPNHVQLATEAIRIVGPTARRIDEIAVANGGRGEWYKKADKALNDLLDALDMMCKGKK